MAEWTDWYAREDPTRWVLPEILRERAAGAPRPRVPALRRRHRGGPTAQVNADANRVANGLIARGVRHGESVSVLLPNCAEFLPVWFGILKAGAVMSPINTAYKGDFLSWTVNLVESRVLVIADVFLDRLAFVAGGLPLLERVVVLPTGAEDPPAPSLPHETLAEADGRARRRARRGRARVDGRRPDHVHVRHHRPLEGRHQAARRRLLLGAERDRGDGDPARRRAGGPPRRDVLLVPAALPLQRAGALRLSGAAGRRARRLRGALLGHPLLAAGDRRGRHHVQRDRGDPLLPVEPAAVGAGPGAPGAHDLRGPRAEGHLPRVRGALRRAPHGGLRPHRDRRRDDDGPDAAAAARGRAASRTRATRSRSSSPAPTCRCRPTPRARSWWTRRSRTS